MVGAWEHEEFLRCWWAMTAFYWFEVGCFLVMHFGDINLRVCCGGGFGKDRQPLF